MSMDNSMTANELQAFIKTQFPKENECFEWKEWRNLRHNISGRKGEDLVSYVSALSNMDGGCIVIGVQDKTLAATGIQDFADYDLENVIHRILGKTTSLPSLGLRVEALQASDTGAVVWLVHVPRHAPRQPVYAHDRAFQRDGDSLVELRPERLQAILTELLVGQDWSAALVPQATLDDLDPAAVAKAREKFTEKHQQERWATEITGWSTVEFLDRAKITLHGQMTRTAILLLGLPHSAGLLPSVMCGEILWKVPDERIAKSFFPPFLLNTTEVGLHIRNPPIKLFPATELLAIELPRYDSKVILEGLHNCIAHQNYDQAGRIVVWETSGQLQLTSQGGFVDGRPEDYFLGERTPSMYRNPWLAAAMNNIGMIDKAGFGIKDMVSSQRKRYLPLPDYEGSTSSVTVFHIYGQVIDANYSKLLIEQASLPLEQVIWLDRVQKKEYIADEQASLLRRRGLITGRKPNFFVSAAIAKATNTQNAYVLNKGFDDNHYKGLIIKRLRLGSASGKELRQLIFDKLPAVLTVKEKEAKVKNLRTSLSKRGFEGVFIEVTPESPPRGAGSVWRIKAY